MAMLRSRSARAILNGNLHGTIYHEHKHVNAKTPRLEGSKISPQGSQSVTDHSSHMCTRYMENQKKGPTTKTWETRQTRRVLSFDDFPYS